MTIIGSGVVNIPNSDQSGRVTIIQSGILSGSCGRSVTSISILDGTPDLDHSSSGPTTNTFAAGEAITVMNLVYLKSDGEWWKTDADDVTTSTGLLAISLESKIDGELMNVSLPGSFIRDGSWAWAQGSTLYIDVTIPGGITNIQPSGTDDVIRVIGWAVTPTIIYFFPSSDYITHI
jgi:hypothetical protein